MISENQLKGMVSWCAALIFMGVVCTFFFVRDILVFVEAGRGAVSTYGDYSLIDYFFICRKGICFNLMMMRMVSAIVCFISAVLLFRRTPVILWVLRVLSIVGCALSFLNAEYSFAEKAMFASIQFVFILYLFQQKIEVLFNMKTIKKDYFVASLSVSEIQMSHNRSLWVKIIAVTEFFMGLLLMGGILWFMPPRGWEVELAASFNMTLSFVLVKPLMILFSLFLCLVGFMTLQFNSWGRKINIYFSTLVLVGACFALFCFEPVNCFLSKSLFSAVLSVLLLWSFCVLFLLSNPNVKQQFFLSQEEVDEPGKNVGFKKYIYLLFAFVFIAGAIFVFKTQILKTVVPSAALNTQGRLKDFYGREDFLSIADKVKQPEVVIFGQESWSEKLVIAKKYLKDGDYREAQDVGLMALKMARKEFGQFHVNVAECLSVLGQVFYVQAQYDFALDYFKRALDIDQKLFGSHDLRLVSDLSNLATTYKAVDKTIDAGLLYKRALKILIKQYGEEYEGALKIKENISSLGSQSEGAHQ